MIACFLDTVRDAIWLRTWLSTCVYAIAVWILNATCGVHCVWDTNVVVSKYLVVPIQCPLIQCKYRSHVLPPYQACDQLSMSCWPFYTWASNSKVFTQSWPNILIQFHRIAEQKKQQLKKQFSLDFSIFQKPTIGLGKTWYMTYSNYISSNDPCKAADGVQQPCIREKVVGLSGEQLSCFHLLW